MTAPPLRLAGDRLACSRGGRSVFEAVSFDVGAGEALVVTGPNGAGKSSLLRLVAGLLPKDAGSLGLMGGDPEKSIGEQVHYAGHADAIKPALTVIETLDFWAALLGDRWLSPEAALALLAIDHLADLPAGYLSAGQRRRLALSRLFVSRRAVWLLDEPTSALDGAAQSTFAELMQRHLAEGGLLVAATHADLCIGMTKRLEMAG